MNDRNLTKQREFYISGRGVCYMSANQILMLLCLVLCGSFGIMAVIFTLLKEKGAVLITGFNEFSGVTKEKREQYDQKRMSRDMRNAFILWSAVLLIGGLLSLFSFYFGIAAGIIWLILCFKDIKWDTEKAFEKYRL